MFGIIYLIIFILTIVYSIEIIKKSKNKIICSLAILLIFIIGFLIGTITGYQAGEIYAKRHSLFDPGVGHTLGGFLEGITFIPFWIVIFIRQYKNKKLGIIFSSIYCIEVIIIWQELFFLLISK